MNQEPAKSKHPWGMVRIDQDRLERLREIARREDRPMVSVIRRAVDRELERLQDVGGEVA